MNKALGKISYMLYFWGKMQKSEMNNNIVYHFPICLTSVLEKSQLNTLLSTRKKPFCIRPQGLACSLTLFIIIIKHLKENIRS